jgi:hypothetical protein
MQNAKDSFYIALRDRLAAVNPARIINIRGVQRPGILVEDAEAPKDELMNDVFVLRWSSTVIIQDVPYLFMSLQCDVHYAACGSQINAGLDRGRALTQMDRELMTILQPTCTPKVQYTASSAVPLQTNVFWAEPVLGPITTRRNQLLRTATVALFAFQEPGEL